MPQSNTSAALERAPRIRPSTGPALLVVVVYAAVFTVTAATSGIPYTEWFDSPANVWRTAVLPLAAGTIVLIAFLWWSRWDGIFRDRERLRVPVVLWVAVAAFVIGIILHLVFVDWSGLAIDLLIPILIAGALVGFAEETLFRGILLRGLRADGRTEATVAVGTSVVFGVFHLTNLVTGSPVPAVLNQVLLATMTGAILYSFRRISGLLLPAMAAHALWDISLFLPAADPTTASSLIGLALLVVIPVLGLIALVTVAGRDRQTPSMA
ncbi:CPBP family intramembrane glutamic endopeptidase [Arthrobacter antioxidans]|uniref:CPBP family intramembrane glutamic endopeptidase n=1 Tax=Arthrobacter antioxidans TaxID=2895818 RepID=UPI00200014EE|nr:CPBP family intramembrane glutamic endopeptidase [Arthrobacter antioxidans]